MNSTQTRRAFLRTSALAAGTLAFPFVSTARVLGANSRLNVAGIGVGGKGWTDVTQCDTESIVALCDVDDARAANTYKRFPQARRFKPAKPAAFQPGWIETASIVHPAT